MTDPKLDEITSHPPMDQLQGLEYCIDSNPSWGEAVLLGFQHYVLSLGTAVMIPTMLVPLMGGDDGDKAKMVQTLLFVGGINTLLQTLFGTRLPTVIGGSYAFIIPIISIIRDSSLAPINDDYEVGRCVEIGLPMLILFVVLSQYLKHIHARNVPVLERYALLISVTVIWTYAYLLTASGAYKRRPERTQINCRADKAHLISSAPWIKIPYPLQWGAPTFDAGHVFGMMAAVLVSLIESTGAYNAAARLASATPPPAYVLSRGIGWQGIAILLDGLFGTGTGSTVSVENIGLLGSTRIGSRRVIQISAGFMIFFSILGKFGALFASIPLTIFAAVYCVFFSLVAAVGLSLLQFTNMNSVRNLFITGVSIFLGLSVPQYFYVYTNGAEHGPAHTRAGWFNDLINAVFSSPATVGLIVAVFLDNTLDYSGAARDRGMPWWVRFRSFKGDSRNEEFYSPPFDLNRFFPPS